MNALTRGIAVAVSVAIHVGGAALALTGTCRARPVTPAAAIVEIDTVTLEAPPVPVAATSRPIAEALVDHAHPYPVPNHDARPHAPSLRHSEAAIATAQPPSAAPATADVAPSPALASAEPALPRFTMSLGGRAATVAGGAGALTGMGAAPADASSAPVLASEASVQARLVASVPSFYPPAARSDEIEGDVSLEIVLDTDGSVTDARVLRAAGHGFDESALTAVRRYRFTSAQRHGHPVRVRMPWTVQFRIR